MSTCTSDSFCRVDSTPAGPNLKSPLVRPRPGVRGRSPIGVLIFAILFPLILPYQAEPKTVHRVYFKGTDLELDVYTIKGRQPGTTLFLLGGIQGNEPGGYLAADLYADLTLRKGNLIVVPRANFGSIVRNSRGVRGDMNRKFASGGHTTDRDVRVVEILKELMLKSDVFLNLHDGSGFYSPKWESRFRNPLRYGQSIIADSARHTNGNGKTLELERIVRTVLAKVNPQISQTDHLFRFNNHRTSTRNSRHKEQRLSATFHALTRVGIPAFGIETSKSIADFRLRVRYQTMIINAFMEEFGIVPDNPRIFLEHPYLKYLVVSINGRTPIVVNGHDVIKVTKGDRVRIVHTESNYTRGLTVRTLGAGRGFNQVNEELVITSDTEIEVRKDRFLIARIPVKVTRDHQRTEKGRIHFEPRVRYFCVKVNGKKHVIDPGEEFRIALGDTLVVLDPKTNLDPKEEQGIRVDLRGFQAASSPYPVEDRGHVIDTVKDLQERYARRRGSTRIYTLQANLGSTPFGRCSIAVVQPNLEYLVMQGKRIAGFVARPGDTLQLAHTDMVRIVDIRTSVSESVPLFVTMSGRTVRWRKDGAAWIDASRLSDRETPLDITRRGRSLGRIWLKQGDSFKVISRSKGSPGRIVPIRYNR